MTPTIGVFDSGFGGLTVLRALIDRIPHTRFAFLGDTARLPYGSKSRRTIARYAAQSAQFLVEEQHSEYLVIACNTASALALDAIRNAVPATVSVIGVIEPGARAARIASKTGDVLVIATDATVQSHAYAAACRALGLRAIEKACPLLVPLVEEGWIELPSGSQDSPAQAESAPPQVAVTRQVVRIYLDELLAEASAAGLNPDVLVLGCTHYPLLKPIIQQLLPPGIQIIDSAESATDQLVMELNHDPAPPPTRSVILSDHESAAADEGESKDLRFDNAERVGDPPVHPTQIRCFATDSVEKFERLGSRFLARPVGKVQLVDLGG